MKGEEVIAKPQLFGQDGRFDGPTGNQERLCFAPEGAGYRVLGNAGRGGNGLIFQTDDTRAFCQFFR
jgi:hypothetical protein